MKILKNVFELNKAVKNYKNVGFVPTMGGIHKGHVSLIKISQKNNKETIVSIFVNPTQFNQKKDFKNYPRNIRKDISILKKLKVNYLFLPEVNEIYKNKMKNFKLNKSDKILCAKYRKGHFEGVLNVMNRLLSIVKSKCVYMGEKDFQQYMLIKRILGKKYKINIVGCPTIRENNKIALSTRNKLLNKSYIKKVSKIAIKLDKLKKLSKMNKIKRLSQTNKFVDLLKSKYELENKFKIKIDYLEFRDEKKMKLDNFKSKYRLFIAYHINGVRLIDNF